MNDVDVVYESNWSDDQALLARSGVGVTYYRDGQIYAYDPGGAIVEHEYHVAPGIINLPAQEGQMSFEGCANGLVYASFAAIVGAGLCCIGILHLPEWAQAGRMLYGTAVVDRTAAQAAEIIDPGFAGAAMLVGLLFLCGLFCIGLSAAED